MAKRKAKPGKVVIVIAITVLIWVYADRALDDELAVPSGAAISIARTDPELWVSFSNESSVSVTRLVLKGPAARIAEIRRSLNDGSLALQFFFEPEQAELTAPGEYPLDVLGFLRRSDAIRKLGVTVETCQPRTATVNIVRLIKRQLKISCIDRDNNPVKGAAVIPARVEMFVPDGWVGDAWVRLSTGETEQAGLVPVTKTPFIELAGQVREAATQVEVTAPPEEARLEEYTITATLGIALSPALQGKYKVEVTNLNEVMSPMVIRATPEAKAAYEMLQVPKMTLYILDEDRKTAEAQRRAVVYNFPPEFVRKKDIELKNPRPVEARFRLIALGEQP